jgi:tRNA nucleotidyltransferase (CCA-adding enzyme)
MTTSTRVPEARARDLLLGVDLEPRHGGRMRRLFDSGLAETERRALGQVARAAGEGGVPLYLVGGALRDLLLRRPVRDLDVAVEGEVRAVTRRVGSTLSRHDRFGTAKVRLRGGVEVDLARTRRERYLRPAALPEISPAGLLHDLARRDFTINAMAAPLSPDGPGGLVDPYGGHEDLRRRRLRVLHERSFDDDPTRALRAVRLAAELGCRLERRTSGLIRSAVERRLFDRLSGLRLARELKRLLGIRRVKAAVRLARDLGLLSAFDAELVAPRDLDASLERLPHLVERHRARHADEPLQPWAIGMPLVLRSSGPETLGRILGRLRLSRADEDAVRDGVEALRRVPRSLAGGGRLRPSRIHRACSGHRTEALLAVAATTASSRVRRAVLRHLDRLREVRAELSGTDLLREGIAPGPAVARGLRAALEARLDGRVRSRDAELRVALAAARRS